MLDVAANYRLPAQATRALRAAQEGLGGFTWVGAHLADLMSKAGLLIAEETMLPAHGCDLREQYLREYVDRKDRKDRKEREREGCGDVGVVWGCVDVWMCGCARGGSMYNVYLSVEERRDGMVDDDLWPIVYWCVVCGVWCVLHGRCMLACWHVAYEGCTGVVCCVAAMAHRMYVVQVLR